MLNEKVIVNVQFKSTLSPKQLKKISIKSLDEMANVKGLITKYYYINPETSIIGGTYLFENLKLAREYLSYFLIQGIGLKYGIIPDTLKMDTGIVHLEINGKNTKYYTKDHNPK